MDVSGTCPAASRAREAVDRGAAARGADERTPLELHRQPHLAVQNARAVQREEGDAEAIVEAAPDQIARPGDGGSLGVLGLRGRARQRPQHREAGRGEAGRVGSLWQRGLQQSGAAVQRHRAASSYARRHTP